MNTIQMLMNDMSVESVLRSELHMRLHEHVVDDYFHWVNNPERVAISTALKRQKGKWFAEVSVYYRSCNGPDKVVLVNLQDSLPEGVSARKLLRRISYRLSDPSDGGVSSTLATEGEYRST